jgi:hypothetical protein
MARLSIIRYFLMNFSNFFHLILKDYRITIEAVDEVRLERETDGQRGEPQEKSHARNQQEDPVVAFHAMSRGE